ncbi:hypothetical protein GCM10011571_33410 [Marinithermofilum abyssi]|uniref:Conjugative transposon protein TcpC n=1 Tax=Marinithermofilum abyssi TaxID=1571185 RepID=A0A8J2YA92_9BACL|nr:conjugal transfer protein [Marinithermofilum abyssi]GGE28634.1 hypothetical protein GCM10011571_33410 [Marinithermofilum abyssi]
MTKKPQEDGVFKPKRKKRREAKPIIVKAALWSVIGFIAFNDAMVDVVKVYYPPPQRLQAVAKQETPSRLKDVTIQGPDNFASRFVEVWLSGDLEAAKTYLADGFQLADDGTSIRQNVSAIPWSTKMITPHKANVVVAATVASKKKGSKPQTLFINVDVAMEGHKYGITSSPQIIPYPGNAKALKESPIKAETDNEKIKQDIETLMDSFFRQYYYGVPNDLANFYADGKPRKTLAGYGFKYQGIQLVKVEEPKGGKAKVIASANIEREGFITVQQFELVVVQKNDRWYVESTVPNIPIHDKKNAEEE